jgi:hypothetical protein
MIMGKPYLELATPSCFGNGSIFIIFKNFLCDCFLSVFSAEYLRQPESAEVEPVVRHIKHPVGKTPFIVEPAKHFDKLISTNPCLGAVNN